MKVGTRVVKNPETWVANDFDGWGRGVGVGIVVAPPFDVGPDGCDVRWPGGRCFEKLDQLLPAPGCPDGGTCHHRCQDKCFRVQCCGPLSGVYPDDEWPEDVVRAHGEEQDMSEKAERLCDVLGEDGRWQRRQLSDVKRGDIFRLWDAEGVPAQVAGGENVEELSVAMADAVDGGVECRPLSKELLDMRLVTHRPPETTGEMHTCPRRREVGLDDPGSPFAGAGRDLDTWNVYGQDRCCSYCGSWHPDEFLAHARAGGDVELSDKGYKIYVQRPGVKNAGEGAIKFYAQHIPRERAREFEAAIDEVLRHG